MMLQWGFLIIILIQVDISAHIYITIDIFDQMEIKDVDRVRNKLG